jgi:predicted nucleotidyltransferase
MSKDNHSPIPNISNYRAILRQSLPALRDCYGVRQLWLYGPHVHGKGSAGMPLDVLADIVGTLTYEDFLQLQATLSQLMDMPVELVLKGSMAPDVADLVIPEMIAIADDDNSGTEV